MPERFLRRAPFHGGEHFEEMPAVCDAGHSVACGRPLRSLQVLPQPLQGCREGVPPQPPAGKSVSTYSSPVSGSAALATNQLHSEQVGAMTWSGIAFSSACQMAAVILDEVAVVHPKVGAGHFGFSHVPSGMLRSICRYSPALGGASGFKKNFSE